MAMSFEEVAYEYDATTFSDATAGFSGGYSSMTATSTCLTYTDIPCHASNAYDSVSNYASGIDWASFGIHSVALMLVLSLLGGLGLYFAYYFVRAIMNRRRNASKAGQPLVAQKQHIAVGSKPVMSYGLAAKMPVMLKKPIAALLGLVIRAVYMISKLVAWTLVKLGDVQKKCVEYREAFSC